MTKKSKQKNSAPKAAVPPEAAAPKANDARRPAAAERTLAPTPQRPRDAGRFDAVEQEGFVRRLWLREANIPPRYRDKTLDHFQARSKQLRDVVAFARDYANTFRSGAGQKGLFIYGCTGCGKSHIASAILKMVMARSFSGFWCNMTDLMNTIRDVIARNAPREDLDFLEQKCAESDLLVLDDMGVETARGLSLERLYGLINRRYESNRPLIVTSNLDLEELSRQFQDENRIMSRIGEICTRFAPFPNVDYRLKYLK